MNPKNQLKYWMFAGFLSALFIHGWIQFNPNQWLSFLGNYPAQAEESEAIPLKNFNNAPIPDFEQITLGNLPPFETSGSAELPNGQTRSWNAGQNPSQIFTLGDFEAAFKLQKFDLNQIGQIAGIRIDVIKLSDFKLLETQNIQDLVKAMPQLLTKTLGEMPPIQEIVAQVLPPGWSPDRTLGEILSQNPQVQFTQLGQIDLSKYRLTQIPGIETVPLEAFNNWQSTPINGVPGLSRVPLSEFPNAPAPVGNMVALMDVPLQQIEQDRQKRVISGSQQEGFNVPCDKDCMHVELAQGGLQGALWIGKTQLVKGGFGPLGQLNSGKEPAGRHPFGDGFKVVVESVDEAKGTATLAMYFRICQRGMPDLGCSPYFLGPLPLMVVKEKPPIFVGSAAISTLESFRQTEALGLLNQILEKAKTDEIQVGDYLISRRRNLENGKGQLCLKKGDRELVKYPVQKTPQGLIKQVDKINLTQWDWQQIQFIYRNTKSLNALDTSLAGSVGNQDSLPFVSQIKVPLHPDLKKAWEYLNQHGWSANTQAGNDRIKATLEQSKGRLRVAEQQELYYKCLLHHQELMSAPNPIQLPSIQEVMKDLERWRKEAISAHYTPTQHQAINREKAADTQAEIAL